MGRPRKKVYNDFKVNKKLIDSMFSEGKGKPHSEDTFATVRNYYANLEYSKRLLLCLVRDIHGKFGSEKTASVLKTYKRVHITNAETFLDIFPSDKCRDIGTWAYEEFGDNPFMYVARCIELMSIRRDRGDSDIDLTSALFYAGVVLAKSPVRSEHIKHLAYMLAGSSTLSRSNPYIVNILSKEPYEKMKELLGHEGKTFYYGFCRYYFESLNMHYLKWSAKSYPRIRALVLVSSDIREEQLRYLESYFGVNKKRLKTLLKGTFNLAEMNESTFELIKQNQKNSVRDVNYGAVMHKLKTLEANDKFTSYPNTAAIIDSITPDQTMLKQLNVIYKRLNVTPIFYERESFLYQPFIEEANIDIDCSDLVDSFDIKGYIYDAALLLLQRARDNHKLNTSRRSHIFNADTKLQITLTNVKDYSIRFAEVVREYEKGLRSYYNRNMHIRIHYDNATASSAFGSEHIEYLRVISDIHADVNKDQNYMFDFGNDFVINCGDTSGDGETTRTWIKNNIRQGVFVGGNHLGYNYPYPEMNGLESVQNWGNEVNARNTMNAQSDYLKSCFKGGRVRYLSNDLYEIDDMIFIGNTFYTDFKLFGEDNQIACMVEAARGLNDYRYCKYLKMSRKDGKVDGTVLDYSPEIQLELFKICFGYIRNRLRKLKNDGNTKPIIIVTHHVPLPYCLEKKYRNDPLSAAFASDLREFITEHPEIRLWCSGHVHAPYDFIYKKTRFVCQPWGYFNENGFDIRSYGKFIRVSDVKSNKPWKELLASEIESGDVKIYIH